MKNSKSLHALNLLQKMASKHHFTLEELDRSEQRVTNAFEYQDANFICITSVDKDVDELLLFFNGVYALPCTPANYENARNICEKLTRGFRHGKVLYQYNEETNMLSINVVVETLHPVEETFMTYLEICQEIGRRVVLEFHFLETESQEEKPDTSNEE